MSLFGPSRPARRPTRMLVAKGSGLDLETVLTLMRRLDKALRIEAYADRLVQDRMEEGGIVYREGTDPRRSRFRMGVLNHRGAGEHEDGEDRDTVVDVESRTDRLVVRVVGRASPFRTGSERNASDPRLHPMSREIADHGIRVLHWAEDAIRACLRRDLPDEEDLVSAAIVCGLEQRSHRTFRGRIAMRRCTLATPIGRSRTLPVERQVRGLDIRTEHRHPLIEAAVPACIVRHVDGEIRLVPVVGAIEGMSTDPMAIMRHYDAANRIVAQARSGGMLK